MCVTISRSLCSPLCIIILRFQKSAVNPFPIPFNTVCTHSNISVDGCEIGGLGVRRPIVLLDNHKCSGSGEHLEEATIVRAESSLSQTWPSGMKVLKCSTMCASHSTITIWMPVLESVELMTLGPRLVSKRELPKVVPYTLASSSAKRDTLSTIVESLRRSILTVSSEDAI
jgi:hypothetical protein